MAGLSLDTMNKSGIAIAGDAIETALQNFVPGIGGLVAGIVDNLTEDEKKDPKKMKAVVQQKVVKELNASQQLEKFKLVVNKEIEDRSGAREMQSSALRQAGRVANFVHSTTPSVLSYGVFTSLLTALYLIFGTNLIEPSMQLMAGGVIGTLSTLATMAFSFWYGGKDKQQDKD